MKQVPKHLPKISIIVPSFNQGRFLEKTLSSILDQHYNDLELIILDAGSSDESVDIAIIETGLRTLLERQDKFGALSPRQESTLKRTLRNSKKARELLHNLLEIGRSEAECFLGEQFQLSKSVLQALADALETNAWGVFEKYADFNSQSEALEYLKSCGIAVDISPQVSDLEMFQDEIKFRQIVGNLIKNALHHRHQRVDIQLEVDGDSLVIAVTDDGPGIDVHDVLGVDLPALDHHLIGDRFDVAGAADDHRLQILGRDADLAVQQLP